MSPVSQWLRMARMLPRAAAMALPGLGPWLARRRWPRTRGRMPARGLHAEVEIIRDRWGVPHLYAKDEHDLFFAQGYVQAQDRLWQMDLGRRLGNGTLAALMGPGGLATDRFMRTLGLRRMAERLLAQVDGDARAILEAYAAGVNARLASGEPLPFEFSLLGATPEPWSPVDTMARGLLLAFLLAGNHRLELLRARVVAEAGEAVAAQLLPAHAPETPLIVPPEARLQGLRGAAALEGLDGVDRVLGDPNIVSGSNNWVVHGSRTASGKPLLANDVHVGTGLPSTWYESGLHGGRFNVVGFCLPGVPLVVLGHNGRIAWGLSNLGPDTQDFYIEKLDDRRSPRRYEHMGQWHDLEIRREEIQVRGGRPVSLEIRSTRHGPVMNEAMSQLLEGSEPLALRWALNDSGPLVNSLVRLNLAGNWEEFRAALALWESPGQNFVYADTAGNIGYQATGKIPIRGPGHQGTVPVPGWTGEHEWRGFIPFEELPASFNPPAGFVATANNKVTADDAPHLLASNWFPGYRARRITDLLAAGHRHTVEDMSRIHAETYSLPAEALRPYLLAVKPEGDAQVRAMEAVRAWDLRYEADRAGATVFEAWYIQLLRRLLSHRLGATLVERYLASDYERHGSMHMPMVIGLMADPDHEWFSDPRAPGRQTRDDAVRLAFAEAVRWLCERYGSAPAAWAWGRVHHKSYRHLPLGRAGPGWLRRLFNSKAFPAPGNNYTVDGASFLWSAPFTVVHGTVQRMVIDLGDLSRSVGLHMPGQSEHLYHPHREDMVELEQAGQTHPLLFTREAVEPCARDTLVLEPGKPG
ncbi:MAG TPA: penicillin acylase family protein [Myxococcales bacterium]|nr:penicillin acylase family protein [Myxococcales bacterium]